MEPTREQVRVILAGRRPEETDLAGVTLDGKKLPSRERELPWDLSGTNLRGAVLTRLDLDGSRFEGADLGGAVFRNVSLSKADFSRASATGAIFEDVNLAYSRFREADLRGASFSFANLADVSFKDADMRGAWVSGVRFSLNGSTHALGLKEALVHRYRDVSYPFVSGVSGDAFWLSYLPERGVLDWGGFPERTLATGLKACGFRSEFVNALEVEKAWRTLTGALNEGWGVITPVHVGGETITGTGFGGSEWVYVSSWDPGRNSVRLSCLLGDDIEYSWDEFVRNWCIHHPLDADRERIIYTMCIVAEQEEDVSREEAARRGVEEGIAILGSGESGSGLAVSGIPAYDLMLRDLETDPASGEEGCRWLGLGLRHHHGSRWAIRDFLVEAHDLLPAGRDGLGRAVALYAEVMDEIFGVFRLLPASLSGDSEVRRFLEHRDTAGKHLRSARAKEKEARGHLEQVLAAVG